MSFRTVDASALRWAQQHSPMPASLVTQAIEMYLQGLARQAFDKTPRVRQLAYMEVGDVTPWQYGELQSVDRLRARVLLGKPNAQWKWKSTNLGHVVRRTA